MAKCIRVPRSEAEKARRTVIDAGMLDLDYRIGSEDGFILIPVKGDVDGYETAEAELRPQERHITDYREAVKGIPDGLRGSLPSSFDIVGDIIIMKFPDELVPYESNIGEALLEATPNIRAVFSDGGVKGEFRIRELNRIAGKGDAVTIHKENGVRLKTDPSVVYFNPRLSGERARVASLVRPGEVVIDMFAGVAPFGCVICRNSRADRVYSIDLNPECLPFAEENARLNKIDNLFPMTGDSTVIIKGLPPADRIVMNLPQMADAFLPDALAHIKPEGTVHMHMVLERDEVEDYKKSITDRMAEKGFAIRIESCIELKNYSPTKGVYVFDIRPARSDVLGP